MSKQAFVTERSRDRDSLGAYKNKIVYIFDSKDVKIDSLDFMNRFTIQLDKNGTAGGVFRIDSEVKRASSKSLKSFKDLYHTNITEWLSWRKTKPRGEAESRKH